MTCGDRRGHAGGAGADHKRVAFIRRTYAIVLNVGHAASYFSEAGIWIPMPMARSPEPFLVRRIISIQAPIALRATTSR